MNTTEMVTQGVKGEISIEYFCLCECHLKSAKLLPTYVLYSFNSNADISNRLK